MKKRAQQANVQRAQMPKDQRLAELRRELATLGLPAALVETLHELCAAWDQMPAYTPRTQAERVAEVEDVLHLATALKARLESLRNVVSFEVYYTFVNGDEAPQRHTNALAEIVEGCEGYRWFLQQGRSMKARKPPAHQARVLVSAIAHHADCHGVKVSESNQFLAIVDACLVATNHFRQDGEKMSPTPLVRTEIEARKLAAEAAAAVEGSGIVFRRDGVEVKAKSLIDKGKA